MSYSEVAARPEEPLPPRTPEARQGRGLGVRRWNDFSSEPMELFLNISGKKKKKIPGLAVLRLILFQHRLAQ